MLINHRTIIAVWSCEATLWSIENEFWARCQKLRQSASRTFSGRGGSCGPEIEVLASVMGPSIRRLFYGVKAWVVISLVSSFALAQGTSVGSANGSLAGSANGTLTVRQEALVSPDYRRTDDKSFSYLGVEFKSLPEVNDQGIRDGLHTEVEGQLAPGNSVLNYFNVNQLYWRQDQFVVGRKKELWSIADEDWKLALFQPTFTWNPLVPETQGLTGIFINIRAQDLSFPAGVVLFGSPVFIPDQGQSYEIKNGRFTAQNPYFNLPPAQAEFSGQTLDINYDIQKPEISEVVFNQSFAMKAYAGDIQDGFYAQAAYAYKPVNQLSLGFRGFITANNELDVEVLPKVWYHRLVSVDVKYSQGGFFTGLGGFQEVVQDPEFDAQWTYNQISNSLGASVYAGMKGSRYWVRGSVLQINGAEKKTSGPDSGNASAMSTPRFQTQRAWQIAGEGLLYRSGSHRVSAETTYRQGMGNEFSTWLGTVQHQVNRKWAWSLHYQLIAVAQNAKQNFYTAYENNDLVGVGVHYVF